jgi:hypothetical protein
MDTMTGLCACDNEGQEVNTQTGTCACPTGQYWEPAQFVCTEGCLLANGSVGVYNTATQACEAAAGAPAS